ncbi:hypothetical protein L8U04_03660 [Campylobacter sp. IFREMER_LSEM_CL908]|uniref:hypothetical protein n=1 Tax=Campylobacter sp. IFREMER_LSEM_CL908 TaxID=2911624 RepID=UPI0021E70954|nr:hypothetical protein [Campylobacter sp. IFREMER_LSEM_CL908]MCV3393646.1 hypothetical protein [Campylobacter sp. IFREMER_LSEM_CL908]
MDKVKDDRDTLRALFETHKTNNERLETRLKEIGRWCEKKFKRGAVKRNISIKSRKNRKRA